TPARGFVSMIIRAVVATIAGLLVQAVPAASQDPYPDLDETRGHWITVDEVEFGAVDLDIGDVEVLGPGVYQVRTRWRFANTQTTPDGRLYETSVAVRGIDCRRDEAALIAFANHHGGRAILTEVQPVYAARWEPVV